MKKRPNRSPVKELFDVSSLKTDGCKPRVSNLNQLLPNSAYQDVELCQMKHFPMCINFLIIYK